MVEDESAYVCILTFSWLQNDITNDERGRLPQRKFSKVR